MRTLLSEWKELIYLKIDRAAPALKPGNEDSSEELMINCAIDLYMCHLEAEITHLALNTFLKAVVYGNSLVSVLC